MTEPEDATRPAAGQPTAVELPTGRKLFVIALRCGRLSNRLILFANFIAMAEEQGHRLINFTFHSYAELFETTRRDIYCQYPSPQTGSWLDRVPGVAKAVRGTRIFYHAVRAASGLNERLGLGGRAVVTLGEFCNPGISSLESPAFQARIGGARMVFVKGWNFRAPSSVQRHAAKIRAYFRPVETIHRLSDDTVNRLRQQADVVVGVHIRQGDYRTWKQGKYCYPVSQYAAWMGEMAEQFPGRKVCFLVCSDEPRGASEFPGLSVAFGGASPVVDQQTLARCDCVFGPPSTFSQWASFYGEKPLLHLYTSKARIERAAFRVSDLAEIPGITVS